jgi:hypothetical protein
MSARTTTTLSLDGHAWGFADGHAWGFADGHAWG